MISTKIMHLGVLTLLVGVSKAARILRVDKGEQRFAGHFAGKMAKQRDGTVGKFKK
jgi:hypothetical protein